MNSLDAIIALLALMSFFALILATLSLFDSNLIISTNKIIANNTSKDCALLMDSYFANSAKFQIINKDCFVLNGAVGAKKTGFTKTTAVLTNLNQTSELEVDTSAHYK